MGGEPAQELTPEMMREIESIRCQSYTQKPLGDWVRCMRLTGHPQDKKKREYHQWSNGKGLTIQW